MSVVVPTKEYFYWLLYKTGSKSKRYSELLDHLFYAEFIPILPMDENRICDGTDLRQQFMEQNDCVIEQSYLLSPCSILELMIALAIRCEIQIMSDDIYGDRTDVWFWEMINSLGLSGMTDDRFDSAYVDDVIWNFIDREYESNGEGSLFTVKNPPKDMRTVEIWYQMMFFLNEYLQLHERR